MSDLYCQHNRTEAACEDCAWQRANADATLPVDQPEPEATRKANRAKAEAAGKALDAAAAADDDVSLSFGAAPAKGRR